MRGTKARKRKQALNGWVKWLIVLAMPFAVLFTDTRLNLRTWEVDYQIGKLKRERRSLEAKLEDLKSEEAQQWDLDRLNEKAPEMELVEPDPLQFKEIAGAPRPLQLPAPLQAPLPMPASPLVLAENPQVLTVETPAPALLTVPAPDFLARKLAPGIDAALPRPADPISPEASAAAEEMHAMLERIQAAPSLPPSTTVPPAAPPFVNTVVQELELLAPLESTQEEEVTPEFLPEAEPVFLTPPSLPPRAASAPPSGAADLVQAEGPSPAPDQELSMLLEPL